MKVVALILALVAAAQAADQKSVLRKVDWLNHSYPVMLSATPPKGMRWLLPTGRTPRVKLNGGRYRLETEACAAENEHCRVLGLEQVEFGKLAGIKGEVAAVVIAHRYRTAPGWNLVYLFVEEASEPKFLAMLETGTGPDFSLRSLWMESGSLVLDVLDPRGRVSECCSTGFLRFRFRWKDGEFRQAGEPVNGYIAPEEWSAGAAAQRTLKKRQ